MTDQEEMFVYRAPDDQVWAQDVLGGKAVSDLEQLRCPICDEIGKECQCLPCQTCGLSLNLDCIKDHGHIPDPVPLRAAAQSRGISRDVLYKWVRSGWVNSRKVAEIRTAPIMVSGYEVMHFEPPTRGWRKGTPKCPGCGYALVKEHECERLRDARGLESPAGNRLGDMENASLKVVAELSEFLVLREAAVFLLRIRDLIRSADGQGTES